MYGYGIAAQIRIQCWKKQKDDFAERALCSLREGE